MFQLFDFLKFFFTATNQHGVHSPFVYQLLTRGLYTKSDVQGPKKRKLLFKCLGYFKVKNVQLNRAEPALKSLISERLPLLEFDTPPFDLIYFKYPEYHGFTEILNSNTIWHNDTLIFIEGIHGSKANLEIWKALIADKAISVSIDLYHCGLLFLRREQAKEHFKIRI